MAWTRTLYRLSIVIPVAFLVLGPSNVSLTTSANANPLTFVIPNQPQFGTSVSGYLTFDPTGVYFDGPFAIKIGSIPTMGLPANQFTNLNTTYVIQPNTSFHSLWVFNPSVPFDQLFLLVGFDSCSLTGSCVFQLTYYRSICSDCPPISSVRGAIGGSVVPEPASLCLLATGLAGLAAASRMRRRRLT